MIGGSNTKNAIVSVLSQGAPLSAQQLFHQVTKETSKPISYQALHKALKELEAQGIIEKTSSQYQLNPQWVHSIEAWAQETKNKIQQQNNELEKPEVKTFENVVELARFLIYDYFNYPNPQKLPQIARWRIMYSLLGLSKEEMDEIRKVAKSRQHFILCKGTSIIDRALAIAFEGMGVRVKLGANISEPFDSILVGDYICEIYFHPEFLSLFKKLWKQPKKADELNINTVLGGMHAPYPCKAIVYRNPVRAQKIREEVLKQFEGGQK